MLCGQCRQEYLKSAGIKCFPGILGPVQPQQQLVFFIIVFFFSLNTAHFEITQVELFVSLISLSFSGAEMKTINEEKKTGRGGRKIQD